MWWWSLLLLVGAALAMVQDVYVVGCGVLGKGAATQWHAADPSATVYGETGTERIHEELRAAGVKPVLRPARDGTRCGNVLFCVPPSAFPSGEVYANEVRLAASECWDKTGRFVLTSSGGVFAEDGGGICTETSPTKDDARAAKMLAAEAAARELGGVVIRLAGLYDLHRGAHEFWFNKGTVDARDDALVNLLNYDDASAAVVAAAKRAQPGDLLLAADMAPRTRQAIVDAAKRHPAFADRHVTFTQVPANDRGPKRLGRRYDCSFTRNRIQWEPRFPTIEAFFDHEAAAAAAK